MKPKFLDNKVQRDKRSRLVWHTRVTRIRYFDEDMLPTVRHLAVTSPVWSPFENKRIELSGSEMICTETVTVFRGDLGFPVFGL